MAEIDTKDKQDKTEAASKVGPSAYSDPYALLDLSRTASAAEIKRAYFVLVRAHPPERDPQLFKQIRAAYEQVRDPIKRAETDMLLLQSWTPPAKPVRKRAAGLPQLDLRVHPEDVLIAARALTDLERSDWREQFRKVQL